VQTQVRPAAQKQFVIVAAGIRTGRDAHKTVQVELSRKGVPCVCVCVMLYIDRVKKIKRRKTNRKRTTYRM
jgi:hypothetical protein